MIIRELLTVWGFDVDEKPIKKLEASISTVNKAIKATAAIGVTAATTLFGLAKSASATGDQIAKTADKIGFSTDALQELRYAAQNATDLGVNAVDMALQRFSRRAAEAANGTGEAKDALAELGVQLTDGAGRMRDADALLMDVADSMANVKGEQDRLRLAFKLFDSEGAGFVNLLKNGSAEIAKMRKEAHDLGGVLGEDQVRASEAFEDAMLRATTSVKGVALNIGAELMPEIQALIDSMTEWIRNNRELLNQRISTFINVLKMTVSATADVFRYIVSAVSAFIDALGGAEKAARFVGLALLYMASMSIVAAIGGLLGTVVKLAAAVRTVGFAAIFTSAVFKRTILGAIFTAALLLGEELYLWFTGKGKTMLGEWLGSWDEVKAKFTTIIDTVKGAWDRFTTFMSESFERGAENIMQIAKWLLDSISAPFEWMSGLFSSVSPTAVQPASAPIGGGVSSMQNINANVTVNARSGMSESDIALVRRQAELGIGDSLSRAASRLAINQPGYLYNGAD